MVKANHHFTIMQETPDNIKILVGKLGTCAIFFGECSNTERIQSSDLVRELGAIYKPFG